MEFGFYGSLPVTSLQFFSMFYALYRSLKNWNSERGHMNKYNYKMLCIMKSLMKQMAHQKSPVQHIFFVLGDHDSITKGGAGAGVFLK